MVVDATTNINPQKLAMSLVLHMQPTCRSADRVVKSFTVTIL